MSRTKNTSTDPLGDLAALRAVHERLGREAEREARGSLRWLYDEGDWRGARDVAKHLGVQAAHRDLAGWIDEAVEVVRADPSGYEQALTALHERARKLYEEPSWETIRLRWDEAQAEHGVSFDDLRFPRAEYSDYFHAPVDVFGWYYTYNFTFSLLLLGLEKLIAAQRDPDTWRFVGHLVNERWEAWAKRLTDEDLANVADTVNSIISGRNTYGLRYEAVTSLDFSVLAWSNGSASWSVMSGANETALVQHHVYGRPVDVGRLDANYVVVPFPPPVVEMILTSLYPLPLYGASMEGKARARAAGKRGPLVSDRTAKTIVLSVALTAVKARWIEVGMSEIDVDAKMTANDNYVKRVAENVWSDLRKAKAEGDETAFEKVAEETGFANVPGFYGQLKNWFLGRRLEGEGDE